MHAVGLFILVLSERDWTLHAGFSFHSIQTDIVNGMNGSHYSQWVLFISVCKW